MLSWRRQWKTAFALIAFFLVLEYLQPVSSLQPSTGTFQCFSNNRRTQWMFAASALASSIDDSLSHEESNPTRNNSRRAREMLQFIQMRYKSRPAVDALETRNEGNSWKKTQMYLYRAHERLTWDQIERVLDFLDQRVPKKTSRTILQTTPRILRKPVDSFLVPTADFLLNLWGNELFLEAINRNPQLLLSNGVGYTQRQGQADQEIIRLLTDVGGLSTKAINQLKQTSPFVFGLPARKVQSVLEFLVELLQAVDHMEQTKTNQDMICRDTLSRIIVTHPHLLNLSVEANLRPRVEFLQSVCDMNATHIAKMVQTSTGAVLSLSVKDNLEPTLSFLHQMLSTGNSGTSPVAALRKSLLSHPQVLTLSMSNLQAKVQLFSDIEAKDGTSLKNNGYALASRILSRCPAVYSLSLSGNIIPKIELLAKVWGISNSTNCNIQSSLPSERRSLAKSLQEFPNILTMSLEGNIIPTLNFFNRTRYTTLTEDWELVPGATRIPGRYMAASLYNRLLPRWHYCLSQGFDATDGRLSPAEVEYTLPTVPLHLLVQADDARFCQTLNLDFTDFVQFKKNAIPRLKFSSQFDTWLKTGRPIQV